MPYRTIIEPFRIKSVEPLRFTTPQERRAALESAGWNLFSLHADDVLIDLLTDSGTGAMSSAQWAALMRGDESYAGSVSFQRFETAIKALTGYRHVIPTHQGRAAERILFSETVQQGDVVPNNTHFDTTRANAEVAGARALDLPCPEAADLRSEAPFKGNLDVEGLQRAIAEFGADRVPLVMVTITNNSGGGQPVSLENLRAVRSVCDQHGIPLILDAARFAENAWFIVQREPGQAGRTPREVAQEVFALADGCTISLKKDGLGNIGGVLAVDDDDLAERCRAVLVLTEGFPTYGGLAGRDLDALAQGLVEVTEPDYLRYRVRTAAYLAERAEAAGVPTVRPPGGHAVYLDARAFLPHIPPHEYPAQALACALYLEGGVRGVEIGTLMFGRPGPDGVDEPAPHELVRLALPRRVYTQSHVDYVGEVIAAVARHADTLRGYRIVAQPRWLRHFTARLEPLG
jgi:tryptophanase